MIKNRTILIFLSLIIISMICLACASVPLYRIYCKATGYGGTTQKASLLNKKSRIGKKEIKVRFNADINNLPWAFYPELPYVTVKPGEQTLIFYRAENLSNTPHTGIAIYNVTPYKAGKYFNKVACFCFSQQTLAPKQKAVMPVAFFIDPDIEDDPYTADVSTLTLSYTFFKYKS
ncbi:cytochrome c oxidase assembly protein [Neoehrlichia mikurensis]|uniref:Cytochrome c oxidase assembly protein CtaG n=1 Tax=Neoehrlichia mikurensis TaxID=89586 RepID=A0A9Q9BYE3_9RICK|nr:cytochrome c oxidase assembly protein [Neoehrlichia mikurensis]QXK91641.1 cytochrome c oxidase assembly protein [Neoehrlichia mikurensis]QXK92852.1 cytochrome c oxidase assembly protein [Neoehrlichia mikurensis]QXK93332.1 cytochrome c oxidase assembly protein [Neoehrlichia mikurensis]UTO55726.1 cytochrome c oxidase assembly protein [Neoehrlichia mikurensis]UTO56643.1 cytochrome c oxidase assembly protein [Neoehrlichia mikurensis]